MADKIKELLAVLDLLEEEQQIQALDKLKVVDENTRGVWFLCGPKTALADLAFRLRDEADPLRFGKAIGIVYAQQTKPLTSHLTAVLGWVIVDSKPIHWIIAALIAKGLTDEQ